MNAEKGQIVDHKDRNTLNNTIANLRFATPSINRQNTVSRIGTSKFKGVCKRGTKYRAYISCENIKHMIGTFDTEILAAQAYDRAAIYFFGSEATTNETLSYY